MESVVETWLSSPLVRSGLTAAFTLLLLYLLVFYVRRSIGQYVEDTDSRYLARKLVSIVGYVLAAGVLLSVFSDRLAGLTVAFGLAGAGIAFALQEVIISVAGWVSISFGSTYKTGDRIRLAGVRGDVIDISVLRTTLMELGEWVDGDLYSGRIVRVSNGAVLKEPVFNYSADFPFLWDEIELPLRHGSDRTFAREMLERIATEVTGEFAESSRDEWKAVVKKYRIENARLTPMVTVRADENWMTYTMRYVVDFNQRRTIKDRLFDRTLTAIEDSGGRIQLAASTLEVSSSPPIEVRVIEGDRPKSA